MSVFMIFILSLLVAFSGWRVYQRAGFQGAFGLLFLLPFVNFFALLYLAYADWPVAKKL